MSPSPSPNQSRSRVTTDPIEAEATGQQHLVAIYRDREYKIPRDVDEWPLSRIAVSVGIRGDKLVSDHVVVAECLRALLGSQWHDFIEQFPRRRDLVPSSQAFAAAAGFEARDSQDKAFGALPRVLFSLATWGPAIEATLGEMGLDYRDRWRFDADGHRKLTLRQIHVRLKYAATTCALAVAENNGKPVLTATDILLMDVYEAIARKVHPMRPMTAAQRAEREIPKKKSKDELVTDYRNRHAKKTPRQTAIETAQANARPRKAAHAKPKQEAEARSGD